LVSHLEKGRYPVDVWKGVLRRKFGVKVDDVTRQWRTLHKERLCDF
jgi:hypothetical protein